MSKELRAHLISEHAVDGTAPFFDPPNEREMREFHRMDHSGPKSPFVTDHEPASMAYNEKVVRRQDEKMARMKKAEGSKK